MTAPALQLLLAIAYPLLAHWASLDGGGASAAIALGDLALLALAPALWRLAAGAWVAAVVLGSALVMLARTEYAQMLLLAPPMLFVGALAWWFGRSLRPPRIALITRIVAAMEDCRPETMPADLYRYSRRLTAAWALLLAALAVANGALALIAVPGGVLARLGYAPIPSITDAQWSLFANLLNYGVVGGFFVGEYVVRQRVLPPGPYRNFFDFLRRMAALGPRFWRGLFE